MLEREKAMSKKVLSIVGKKRSGKTTLIERLIPALNRRGVRVGTIKHDAHRFDMDHPGKDTYRHFAAGAEAVVIASAEKLALQKRLDGPRSVDDLASRYLSGVDLVLTEGYRSADKPKVEVYRRAAHAEMLCGPEDNLLAVVSDDPVEADCPRFGLDDGEGLADFIALWLSEQ
jgi:molybdopterin-guanine dinucleotide biosynthesis protein B